MNYVPYKIPAHVLLVVIACFAGINPGPALAQKGSLSGPPRKLTLSEAIALSKSNNSQVKAMKLESEAVRADLSDARANALPSLVTGASYQRFTNLTLYESGLSRAHSVPKRPSQDGADATISANFNLYAGGRQRAMVQEQLYKSDLADIIANEVGSNTALQAAAQYLDMVRLNGQRGLLAEQVIRAEARLKNIRAFFNNQKVTRSDLLRAELNLSAVKLGLQQAENDMLISNQRLNVLLNVPDSVSIVPLDSAGMELPPAASLLALTQQTATNAYSVRRADENIRIQGARIRGLQSNYRPTVSLYSAYGISYPNTIFFPPVDQAYSIGFVGLKVQYNISSLYHNKQKVEAGKIRLRELEYVQQNVVDNARQEAAGLVIKYQEALNRVAVNESSIAQANVNLRIVNAKYLNQLALLTDLLDADDLFQRTRYDLVLARTNARLIYFRLLYISGNL